VTAEASLCKRSIADNPSPNRQTTLRSTRTLGLTFEPREHGEQGYGDWCIHLFELGLCSCDGCDGHLEAMFHITIAWAGVEKQILSERTRTGMERAREGKKIGRPAGNRWPLTHSSARSERPGPGRHAHSR
jgi:hypothetical protein